MPGNLTRRLAALETIAQPAGKPRVFIVGSLDDHGAPPTPEQFKAELTEARAQAGPDDTIIKIVYVKDWRPNEPTADQASGMDRGFNPGQPAI